MDDIGGHGKVIFCNIISEILPGAFLRKAGDDVFCRSIPYVHHIVGS